MENKDLVCPNCHNQIDLGSVCHSCETDQQNLVIIYSLAIKYHNKALSLYKEKHITLAFLEIQTSITIFPFMYSSLHLGFLISIELGEYSYASSLLRQLKIWLSEEEFDVAMTTLKMQAGIYNSILQNKKIPDSKNNLTLIHYYILHLLDKNISHREYINYILSKNKNFVVSLTIEKQPKEISSIENKPKHIKLSLGLISFVVILLLFINYNLFESRKHVIAKMNALQNKLPPINAFQRNQVNYKNKSDSLSIELLRILIQKQDYIGMYQLLKSDTTLVSELSRQQRNQIARNLYINKQYNKVIELPFNSNEKAYSEYYLLWLDYSKECKKGTISKATITKMISWLEVNKHKSSYVGDIALALFNYYEPIDKKRALIYAKFIKEWVHKMPQTNDYLQYLNGPVKRSLKNET